MHNCFLPSSLRHLVVLAAAAASAAAQSLLGLHGEIVLAAGDNAPGIPGATVFAAATSLDSPAIDQNGTFLFRCRIGGAGTSVTDDRAYFMGRSYGDLQLVVRAGDQAPGCPIGTLLRSSTSSAGLQGTPRISPFNELVLFQSKLYDPATPANTPTTSDTGIFWGQPTGLVLVAREGEQVPFLAPGVLYGEMNNASLSLGQFYQLNTSGQILFTTPLTGAVTTGDDAVLVTGVPPALVAVSREGDVLLDGSVVSVQATTPTGSVALSFINHLNEFGQVLHEQRFSITTGTATAANDRALAIWTGSSNQIIAREGDAAPGTAGAFFGTSSSGWSVDGVSQFTRSGKTTLWSALTGGDVSGTTNDRALYFGGLGGWTMIMRKGDLAPGLAGGEIMNNVSTSGIACNDAGVAFLCTLVQAGVVTAANDSSLWFGTAGNLQLLAREGDPVVASGLTGGPWTYQDMSAGGTATPRLNERGQLLWQPSIGDGVTIKTVMLGWSPGLGWQLVSSRDESITTSLGTGTVQGISSQGSASSGDGGVVWFNNSGDFAIVATMATPVFAAMMRGHIGSLIAEPATIQLATGGAQDWHVDCGPAHASEIYIVIGSQTGTRPGTLSPLGPQLIPLNFDSWTLLTIEFANSPVFAGSIGLLDGSGKASAAFNLPPGLVQLAGQTLHHAVVTLDLNLVSTFASEPSAVKLW